MKYIIIFEDAADADPEIRKTHMTDHLSFLEDNAAFIDAAGPLNDPEGKGRDGLWIVDVEDELQARQLIHKDPFWPTGLRASFSIIGWKRVFLDGERLIAKD